MLSSGQHPSIGNDGLVTRRGSFYANINDRLEYKGRDYDYNLNEVVRTTASELNLLVEYESELTAVLGDLDPHVGFTIPNP